MDRVCKILGLFRVEELQILATCRSLLEYNCTPPGRLNSDN